jgi:hypothetical protein
VLFSDNLNFNPGSYFAIQSLTSLPLAAPAWTVPVGYGYRLIASANAPSLVGTSLNMSYLESDVVAGTEGGIGMYYLPAGGTQWQRLATRLDPQVNEISAKTLGPGSYVLMSALDLRAGWNMFSYPWPRPTLPISEGLALVNGAGAYTTLYGYDAGDPADHWKLYDIDAPAWVNDLRELRYSQAYWVRVTTAGQPASTRSLAALNDMLTLPPATYYGRVPALAGLRPAVGERVEARIGGVLCGQATTQIQGGQVVFAINVESATQSANAGCGLDGRAVRFTVGGVPLPQLYGWDNSRPINIDARLKIYLPGFTSGGL